MVSIVIRLKGGQMAVQRYSRLEMQVIISNILKEDVTILPIGNHELRRHLVYRVETKKGPFVFKYYYQDIYGGREISALKLLEDTPIPHASLIDYGVFGSDREWLMMSLLEGMPMDKIMKHMSKDQLIDIYYQMGKVLGQIHESHTFEAFGDLAADHSFVKAYQRFGDAFTANNQYCYDKIYNSKSGIQPILVKAIKRIEKNMVLLDGVKKARLTHMDYSPRNIFLTKEKDKRVFKAVLDFELCRPWDKNADFSQLILRDFSGHPDFEKAFYKGYESTSTIEDLFYETTDFYTLNLCIQVCSWAEEVAPKYFDLALNTLMKILNESKTLK